MIGIIAGDHRRSKRASSSSSKGIDDPVGAISVHGVGGIFGVLCVGIFANGEYGAGWNGTTKGAAATATGVTGILYDGEPRHRVSSERRRSVRSSSAP